MFRYHGGQNGIMEKDAEAVLFTDIVIPTEWGNKEMKKVGRFQVVVSAEAIQSNGFASANDAFLVLGQNLEKGIVDGQN